MKQIDLEPHEYRQKGLRRFRRSLSERFLRNAMVASGIWAGCWLYAFRNYIEGDNPWIAAAVVGGPGLALWVYVILTVRD